MNDSMRDHGGNLDWAIDRYGGSVREWTDLSTGINRSPYPLPVVPSSAWTTLPMRTATDALCAAASRAYASDAPIVALAGAQAAIQLIPRLAAPRRAAVLGPTYNEHVAALRSTGWQVEVVETFDALSGADLAVVVNPNNPDGSLHDREALLDLSTRVGRLVIDESFIDATPERSLAPLAGKAGLLVLRSFGKFYGLAGLRLGFALGSEPDIAALAEMSGPWPVSGAAIEIGTIALADEEWRRTTSIRLAGDANRLDALAAKAGWHLVGGTALFRLYDTPDSEAARSKLAGHYVWSRSFRGRGTGCGLESRAMSVSGRSSLRH